MLEAFAWLGDAIASSTAGADTANSAKSTLPEAEKSVDKKLADMRSPFALSAKLEEWLSRAEKDCTAEDLLQQFYALDLPSWDHYTHLRLAYILLLKHGRREGTSPSRFRAIELMLTPFTQAKTRSSEDSKTT